MNQLLNIIDLEATCWEGEPPPGQVNEVIEIGVCVLDLGSLERLEKRAILVRPQRSEVSAFCTQLTGLTPQEVAQGITFSEACEALRRDFQADSRPWASWGDYDWKQLQKQSAELGLSYPMSQQHTNAKKVYADAHGLKRRPGMAQALEHAGLALEGRHHRGVDDAWNIAALVIGLIRGGKGLPESWLPER